MCSQAWTVTGYLAVVSLLAAGGEGGGGEQYLDAQRRTLGLKVAAIQRADYAGQRDALKKLAAEVEELEHAELAAYREYWVGFALWRRAINGFNDDMPPAELRADLEAASAAFRRALEHQPGWLEAKVGLAGCAANLQFLAGSDAARRDALLTAYVPFFRDIAEQGQANPRALWIVAGSQLAAPPPRGGHPEQAAATYRAALAAARAEALAHPDQPAWIPTWGAPENLMGLAYTYTSSTLKNRALALAYAEGALAAVPHWRYVRETLLPQARSLP